MNKNLLNQIYRNYYLQGDVINEDYSSHWQSYVKSFSVKLDKEGSFLGLKGFGFGDQKTRNFFQKGMNWINHLINFLNSDDKKGVFLLIKKAQKLCKLSESSVSFDVFKQILSLNLIMKYMSAAVFNKQRSIFLVIGDGYGFMASLIKECFPNSLVILVDLGKTLLFQAYHCQRTHLHYKHEFFSGAIVKECDFLYCPADKLNELSDALYAQELKIDVSVNIASMQEMTLKSIEKYFCFLRTNSSQENLFYCCNREKKTLIGGEALEIRKYPYESRDYFYADEYCPWYKFFLTARPYLHKNKPKLMGIKLPFINYFDGALIHRLVRLDVYR